MVNKPFKIALIGCGAMANNMHGPAIRKYVEEHPNTIFAACCDINEDNARTFAEKFNIPAYYTCIDTMLDTEKPNAVNLIAPEPLTAELSCKILDKGYPLIMEKPPGLTGVETRCMMFAAADTPNTVAFNRRYMPIVLKTKIILGDWCAMTEGNHILDIRYNMVRHNRTDTNFATTAIHGIDLVRYLADANYKKVNFRYQNFPHIGETVANFFLDCEMENGIHASLSFQPISHINIERVEINTTGGLWELQLPIWAGCHDGNGKITRYENNEIAWERDIINVFYSPDDTADYVLGGFYYENAIFYNNLRKGINRPDIYGIESGLQSVEIAECIQKRMAEYRK